MFEFNRIRTAYDFVTNPDRYRSDNDVDLDEATDPQTWRDQTKPTLRERFASRWRLFLAFSFLGVIALGLIAAYSQRYLPSLYGNIWVQRGIVVLIGVPSLVILGAKIQRGKEQSVGELALLIDGEPKSYYGRFDTDAAGNTVFEPLKGFDWWGMRAQRLTLADLDESFTKTWAKEGRDPDDPVRIRIEDAIGGQTETATGPLGIVLTGGLEVDDYGRDSDLYTTAPDVADEEQYRELVTTLAQVHDENAELRDELQRAKAQRDEWKHEAQKSRDELIDEYVERFGDLAEAGFVTQQVARGSGGRLSIPIGSEDGESR